MPLSDWELVYDRSLNKWSWVDIRTLPDPALPKTRVQIGQAKNGFYPYEFNFVTYQKDSITQCSLCGIFRQSRKMTRDHIWPKSKGGDKTSPACKPCNQAKQDMKPIDWAIYAFHTGKDLAVIPQDYDPASS